jgi:tetratricopeptide (TPR) repeat protein
MRILFLAANPFDITRLRLDQEIRSIDQALRQAEFRDNLNLIPHGAVRVTDLQSLLLRHKPDIVHFSGHGTEGSEIILEDDTGQSYPVSTRALSSLFSVLRDNIRCVVLNACYSEEQARAIAEHIDCVIGISEAIRDASAISFATAFYRALGYGRDVKTAFDLGCIQVDLENLGEQDKPRLLALKGKPEEIVLVATKLKGELKGNSAVAETHIDESTPQKDVEPVAAKRQIDTEGGNYTEVSGPVTIGTGDFFPSGTKISISPPAIVTVVLVIIVALSLIAIVLFTLFPEWWTTQEMPEGSFNIAVAQFISADDKDYKVDKATSRRLSNVLFEAIKRKIRPDQGIVIWDPPRVSLVSWQDLFTRAADPERIASRKNISLLIYGVVTPTADGYQLEPEFYISPEGAAYAEELFGSNRFGQAIFVKGALLHNSSDRAIATQLDTQLEVETLQQLVLGLADFYHDDYNQAYLKFALAADIADEDEVIYLLMGAAKLRAYGPESAEGSRLLLDASEAFTRAVQINPDYARSYLGLAAVAAEQAMRANPVDESKLAQAETWYLTSLNLPDQPPSAYIPAKAYYGLGRVYFNRYFFRYQSEYSYNPEQLCGYTINTKTPDSLADQAREYFQADTDIYQANPSHDLAWFAGHALAQVGWIDGSQGDWVAMSKKNQEAIQILSRMAGPPDDWISLYWRFAAEAETCLNNLDKACDFLERAILTGESIDPSKRRALNDEDLADWQAQLERLECSE